MTQAAIAGAKKRLFARAISRKEIAQKEEEVRKAMEQARSERFRSLPKNGGDHLPMGRSRYCLRHPS